MILLDANLLIYAYDPASPFHAKARPWLESMIAGSDEIAIPWVSIWAFLRICTHPRVAGIANPIPQAFQAIADWSASGSVQFLHPGRRHPELLRRMADQGKTFGPMMTDAVLAAIAVEYGATLASTDRDFSRFPGLKWINPLD